MESKESVSQNFHAVSNLYPSAGLLLNLFLIHALLPQNPAVLRSWNRETILFTNASQLIGRLLTLGRRATDLNQVTCLVAWWDIDECTGGVFNLFFQRHLIIHKQPVFRLINFDGDFFMVAAS